jgi:hypothetical protein
VDLQLAPLERIRDDRPDLRSDAMTGDLPPAGSVPKEPSLFRWGSRREGRGKSTLLRAMAGLDAEYEGSVLVPAARSVKNLASCRGATSSPT